MKVKLFKASKEFKKKIKSYCDEEFDIDARLIPPPVQKKKIKIRLRFRGEFPQRFIYLNRLFILTWFDFNAARCGLARQGRAWRGNYEYSM